VVTERAHGDGAPCVLTTPVPPVTLGAGLSVSAPAPAVEREGWARLQCVDRRGADPRSGLFSEEFVQLAHAVLDQPAGVPHPPLVCVYNRTGGARLLACAHCGQVAQCARCTAALRKVGEVFSCPRCGEQRPVVCAACGRLRMKTLRAGVSRQREEVAALLGTEVMEVSGPQDEQSLDGPPVLMGTEAVLHRVRRAAAVAFLDIDLHLLAPRFSAPDETLALLVRASRLVGPRSGGPPTSRVLVQTRVPDHAILQAVAQGEPAAVFGEEEALRRQAGLPPFSALAALSGPLAEGYAADVERAGTETGVTVSLLPDGRHLVRAPDHAALCDVLAATPRPAGRGLRVEVDPTAI
jgi:primosomal protein N' (replication factor Y) (superfamily II helicase)